MMGHSDLCHSVVISVILRLREKQFFILTFYGLEVTEPLSFFGRDDIVCNFVNCGT